MFCRPLSSNFVLYESRVELGYFQEARAGVCVVVSRVFFLASKKRFLHVFSLHLESEERGRSASFVNTRLCRI